MIRDSRLPAEGDSSPRGPLLSAAGITGLLFGSALRTDSAPAVTLGALAGAAVAAVVLDADPTTPVVILAALVGGVLGWNYTGGERYESGDGSDRSSGGGGNQGVEWWERTALRDGPEEIPERELASLRETFLAEQLPEVEAYVDATVTDVPRPIEYSTADGRSEIERADEYYLQLALFAAGDVFVFERGGRVTDENSGDRTCQ